MRALAREPADRFGSAAETRTALDQAAVDAPIDQTQVLAIEAADPTLALGRNAFDEQPKESRVAAALPPAWAGKRLAKLLVPLILIALLAWGLVAATAGPTMTKVPTLTGMSLSSAESIAKDHHLVVNPTYAYSNSVARGFVIDQSSTPGTMLRRGSRVTLTVSNGRRPCCSVPDVTGMTQTNAKSALAKAGLVLGSVSYIPSPGTPDGIVLSQYPSPGQHLQAGQPVGVVLAGAPRPTPAPKHHHGKGGEG